MPGSVTILALGGHAPAAGGGQNGGTQTALRSIELAVMLRSASQQQTCPGLGLVYPRALQRRPAGTGGDGEDDRSATGQQRGSVRQESGRSRSATVAAAGISQAGVGDSKRRTTDCHPHNMGYVGVTICLLALIASGKAMWCLEEI